MVGVDGVLVGGRRPAGGGWWCVVVLCRGGGFSRDAGTGERVGGVSVAGGV